MRPLKVLYLIDGLGSGGAQRQLVTLLRAADRAAVSPEVAYYRDKTHFVPALEDARIPIHPLIAGGGRDPRTLVMLRKRIRSGRYDLIHTYLTRPGVLARLATLTGGPPIVLSERSVSLGMTAWLRAAERMLHRRAAAMIVNAEAIREHVEQTVPAWRGRIAVVLNGIEMPLPTPAHEASGRSFRAEHLGEGRDILLAVVARIAEPKNPHMLLDALAELPGSVRDRVSVVWLGACRVKGFGESVNRRVGELGLDGTIRFLEPVRDVTPIYLASDATLLPSRWEGFPNTVLESLALGRPVVATSVGDVPTLVRPGQTGLLVRPDDAHAFALAISELAGMSVGDREAMGGRGKVLVRAEFSSERLFDETLAVYRRLLAARSA